MGRGAGFTLIELLVALAIFAVISVMTYTGLQTVLTGSQQVTEQARRLEAIQRAFGIVSLDLTQLVPRGIRDQQGDPVAPMLTDEQGLRFTRGGRRNPLGFNRSDLQRVGYGLDDEAHLVRYHWRALDQPIEAGSQPQRSELLDDVRALRFRFYYQGRWRENWPPETTGQPVALPEAVAFQVDLDDYGELERVFRVTR